MQLSCQFCLVHQTLPDYFTFHGKALEPDDAYQFGILRLLHCHGILKLKILEIATMVGFILDFKNGIMHMLWWMGLPNIKVSVSPKDLNKPSIMNWVPFISTKLIFVSSDQLIFKSPKDMWMNAKIDAKSIMVKQPISDHHSVFVVTHIGSNDWCLSQIQTPPTFWWYLLKCMAGGQSQECLSYLPVYCLGMNYLKVTSG